MIFWEKYRNFGIFFLISFFIVAFGQPAFVPFFGFIASCVGFALFWKALLTFSSLKQKFWIGCAWYAAILLVQLSWLLAHPFLYIYCVYFVLAALFACQFGILCLFINQDNLNSSPKIIGIAGLWTLMEWSRLYILSGYTWNPVGLTLTVSNLGMQTATLWGIFGLTFIVIVTNLLFLRAWVNRFSVPSTLFFIAVFLFPYLYGYLHIKYNEQKPSDYLSAALVQTAFPVEENMTFQSVSEAIAYVFDEWTHILHLLKAEQGKKLHLIALPEYVVPYGTYNPIFSYGQVKETFYEVFGQKGVEALPPLQAPLAQEVNTPLGKTWVVSNGFWAQALSNYFQSDLIVGLQDEDWISNHEYLSYSGALFFKPDSHDIARYDKRVLVPMGEYIPFTTLKDLAARYGVKGSFTPGTASKVFSGKKAPFGVSICYEETYGHLMRENRLNGANLLVNLTSDAWFPNSKLPKQHLDHAKLRAVEMGIPLLRACNTGITCAIDSFGREIKSLGNVEWEANTLHVDVPLHTHTTLYAKFGDLPIILFSLFSLVFLIPFRKNLNENKQNC